MITPSFSLTATERVLPKLALDFTTASLDPRVTFTRTTGASNPATYINSSGYITAATNNQPRFDYDPVTLACKGLLIEESRSNLITYSQDLSNVAWVAIAGVTLGVPTYISPNGSLDACKVSEDSTNGLHRFNRAIGTLVSASTVYTISAFFAPAERSIARFYLADGVTTRAVEVNVAAGTVTTVGGVTAPTSYSITKMSSGYYRVLMTLTTSVGATTVNPQIRMCSAAGTESYQGITGYGMYIWGFQVEAGAFATSYIPTTTTALTRNADVATMTGTNFSDWFNQTEGTFFIEGSRFNQTGFSPFFSANNGTTEIYAVQVSSTGRAYIGADGAVVCNGTWNTNVTGSMAFAYKTNDAVGSFEGTTVATDTSVTLFTADRLRFGNRAAGTNQLSGYLVKMSYWPSRLTNAEVQAFSK